MQQHTNIKTKKIIVMALLLAIALTIFVIESQIPPIVPIQGVKLGLANIITLVAMYYIGTKEAVSILLMRIVIGNVFYGQIISFSYSLIGGILCLIAMLIFKNIFKGIEYIPLISVIGAIAHNIGQILVAVFLINSTKIMYYLPILIISGIITGFFTGYIVFCLSKRNIIICRKKS